MIVSKQTGTATPEKQAAAGLIWLQKQSGAERWNLTAKDQANLLGGIPLRSFNRYVEEAQKNQSVKLSRDVLERISVLLGIHKALSLVAPEGEVFNMFNRPTSGQTGVLFGGNSIRDFLLADGSMQSLYVVRRHLNAKRS